ncbi:MAG: hypothetical protein ACOYEV_00995 [Candidatus Nanopelagicales bacterium]
MTTPSAAPVPISQRRRRPRLSQDQVAERMYVAAREILHAQGITIALDDLALDDVIARAGVPRSSVYRKWPFKADFVADLLANLAGPDWMNEASFDAATLAEAAAVLLSRWPDAATPEGRRALFTETVRIGVQANWGGLVSSGEWYVYYTLCITARPPVPGDEQHARLVSSVHAASQSFVDTMAGFYQLIGDYLGIRPKAPAFTLRHVVAAGAALIEGMAVNQILAVANAAIAGGEPDGDSAVPEWTFTQLLTDPLPSPHGSDGSWTLPAIAYLGVLDSMLEMDPDWKYEERHRELFAASLGALVGR